jgi:hypothetical protein
MRLGTLLVTCSVVLASPAASQELAEQPNPAQARLGTVQIVAWNRSGQPIDLDVRLSEERILTGELRAGTVATSIEAARILQREQGTYTLHVVDRTRDLQDSVTLRIDSVGQNLGIHLTPDGLAFVLSRGDVTRFTPPPGSHSPAAR